MADAVRARAPAASATASGGATAASAAASAAAAQERGASASSSDSSPNSAAVRDADGGGAGDDGDADDAQDVLLSVPELDGLGYDTLELRDAELTHLDTAVPVLRIGGIVFHGQHQYAAGTVALLSPACAHGAGASAGSGLAAPACCRARARDTGAAAEGRPPIAALTRHTVVFKRVAGASIDSLLKALAPQQRARPPAPG